jgi:hypothetical protein
MNKCYLIIYKAYHFPLFLSFFVYMHRQLNYAFIKRFQEKNTCVVNVLSIHSEIKLVMN